MTTPCWLLPVPAVHFPPAVRPCLVVRRYVLSFVSEGCLEELNVAQHVFFLSVFGMKHLLPTCHMWRSNERVSSLREPPLYLLCSILVTVYSTQNCGVCWLFCKWCKCGGLARTRLSCTLFHFKHPTSSRITHICHRTFLKSQGRCTSQS